MQCIASDHFERRKVETIINENMNNRREENKASKQNGRQNKASIWE
jgi:hypothetical protein